MPQSWYLSTNIIFFNLLRKSTIFSKTIYLPYFLGFLKPQLSPILRPQTHSSPRFSPEFSVTQPPLSRRRSSTTLSSELIAPPLDQGQISKPLENSHSYIQILILNPEVIRKKCHPWLLPGLSSGLPPVELPWPPDSLPAPDPDQCLHCFASPNRTRTAFVVLHSGRLRR